MLARQPLRIDPGQLAERGGAGPAREPALARRVAGPMLASVRVWPTVKPSFLTGGCQGFAAA